MIDTTKIFPMIQILIDIAAAVIYAVNFKNTHSPNSILYWLGAALLNICVTFKF